MDPITIEATVFGKVFADDKNQTITWKVGETGIPQTVTNEQADLLKIGAVFVFTGEPKK